MKKFLLNSWHLLKKSTEEFFNDNAMKFGASLAYYTLFSIPPLLVIIISLCGIFFGAEAVRGEIYSQIKGLVGYDVAVQIQDILKNVSLNKNTVFATVVGIGTLIFGASAVFAEIQDSINKVWGLKTISSQGVLRIIRNRVISFSMIVSLGFLLLVSLIINGVLGALSNRLQLMFPEISIYIVYVLNMAIFFILITLLFTVIFKTLPDGNVYWKDALLGASFTAIFSMLGKSLIGAYLAQSDIMTIYGTAGSVILILLWVYYSSIILFFGAEFTKVYAYTYGRQIVPYNYAKHVETKKIVKTEDPKEVKMHADVE